MMPTRRNFVLTLHTKTLLLATSCTLVTASLSAQGGGLPPGTPPGMPPGMPTGMPGMGRGGPGLMGGVQEDRPLVQQFDTDRNGRLDTAERKTAREWLATEGASGATGMRGPGGGPGFGPGGGRGPGGPGGRGGFGPRTAASSPGAHEQPGTAKAVPASVSLYDMGALRTVYLEFENSDWEQELEAFYHTDVEVPATVTVDGTRFPNVGVHFRGNSSYMMVPRGSKRSLNLSFDFVDEKQALYGYRSINLLNANGDPTFLRTSLFSHIANQYLPAPRANLSRVVINGEVWGVYVNVQQYNKDFLRDFYKTTDGARWKVPGNPMARGGLEYLGDSIAPYRQRYEIKTKNDSASWRALVQLTRVLNTTPADQLEQALSPLLDIDGALRFIALDNVLANSDGYWTRASDYNIYLDPKGRFHVLPHDMNEALIEEGPPGGMRPGGMPPGMPPGAMPPGMPPGGMPSGGPGGRGGRFMMPQGGPTLDPLIGLDDATKPLRSKLLAVPAFRQKYLGYVRDMATTWLDWSRISPMLTRWQSLIVAEVAADTKKLSTTEAFRTGFDGGEESLKAFIEARHTYLLKATAAPRD